MGLNVKLQNNYFKINNKREKVLVFLFNNLNNQKRAKIKKIIKNNKVNYL